ncbi:MAG: sugar phosphate isomerase/epimerase family protein, partial [Fimbriiglobus sp.]
MNIAVSNIAWPADRDDTVAARLVALGATGVEVAPGKLFPSPVDATDAEIDARRREWEGCGLPVVAAQALLFGKPELTLFASAEIRARTLKYLVGIARVCGRLGARALVFGAPKNRLTGGRDRTAVFAEAVEFFGKLAAAAADAGTAVVMEANPPEYGADFATRAADALELVRAVDHPGFRLHLDSACMALAGDDPTAAVSAAGAALAHVHASEPNLAPVGGGSVDHAAFAAALRAGAYGGWVSVEMRQPEPYDAAVLAD